LATRSPSSRQGRAYGRDEIEQLLREALAELMADGTPFRDLSVDRLVTAVGAARSTFYKYFDDKSAMLQALSANALKHLYAAQRLWIAKGEAVTRDDVRHSMRVLLDAYLDEEAVMRAVAEASVYDGAIGAAYVSGVEDYAHAMERFIRAGQKRGAIKDLDAGATALAIAWMVERNVSRLTPEVAPRRLDVLADTLANIVWSTLFD